MAAETSSSADSYIGSLIGLTSKSDIRYEGILYNINTEESSVGLRNVRTFGTEGRRKDGPQVLPSDKVYEYILFRGSDIKDLQVKSSPPVQPTPSLSSDPAIIQVIQRKILSYMCDASGLSNLILDPTTFMQSHYSHPTSTATNLPATVSGSLTDASSHSAQLGHPLSAFQGGLPLYQPGGNLESWGPSPPPPNANGSGLALPTYWQGFYAPQNGLLQLHQQSLLRPSPGLSVPPSMQPPMQYPGFSASLPSGASSLPGSNLSEYSSFVPTATSSLGLTSTTSAASIIPPSLHPVPSTRLASDLLPSSMLSNTPNTEIPPRTPTSTLQSPSSLTSSIPDLGAVVAPSSNKNNAISAPALLYQTISQPISTAIGGPSSLIQTETPTPSLVTPGQLRQSGPFMVSSSNSSQIGNKDGGAVQVSPAPAPARAPKLPVSVPNEAQPPILPSPSPSHVTLKMDRAPFQTRQNYYRGRGRGRGAENSRPVAKFTEDFDFTAMNEKFNKDEVWGHLGKNSQLHSMEKEGDEEGSYEYDFQDENEAELPKFEAKPVYKKDDFFDSISCNALDNGPNNGRRFSEQMKLDTETFGYFSRVRGGHGGCSPSRGGRFRGSYYERGNGYGYGYMGRGRGRGWGV